MNGTQYEKQFRDAKELLTERLLLRKMARGDADDMYDYAQRADVTRYLLWDPHPNRVYTVRYLSFVQSRYRNGSFNDWAVVCRADGRMIGTCGFTRFDRENRSAEIGYVINPRYQNRGYATEAVREALRFGFGVLGLHRIEARYMLGNDASRRVMDKVGMTPEGISRDACFVKGRFVSVATCSILDDEYRRQFREQEESGQPASVR